MVHPEVAKFYNQTGIEYLQSAHDANKERFEQLSKDQEKTLEVDAIYRVKLGGLKAHEYLWYVLTSRSKDYRGNPISFTEPIGKYEMPQAQFNFDEASGKSKAVAVQDFKTVYELPFDAKLITELEEKCMITDTTRCYINNGSRTYGDIYLDNLKHKDFEELVFYGINRSFPTQEQKEMMVGPPSKRMGVKA